MAGGGQIGNKNAYKSGPLTHEQKKHYGRVYMRKRRALLKGDIAQAYQFVGRPRKIKAKGDIFDVAAKLANSGKALLTAIEGTKSVEEAMINMQAALTAWHEYWEND